MRRLFCAALVGFGSAPASGAELLAAPLPPLPPDQEVNIDELTLPPGFVGQPHRHDAYVYVYVVAGTVEMQVAGKPVQRLTAGQVFTENPGDVDTVMRNPSDTEPARFVAFIVKRAGTPTVLPASVGAQHTARTPHRPHGPAGTLPTVGR
jgi:quercetin dioxygenase-like cupin family protein